MPAITVLMPVYNAEEYLKQAIESILNQTFTNFEFLIINDCSTDSSFEIIKSYDDNRIRLVHNEKRLNLTGSLNKGIDLAKGKYIARMDADDISLPQRLQKQYEFMESNHEIGICGTWVQSFGLENAIAKYQTKDIYIKLKMLHESHFCHPSVIIRTTILKQHNLYYNPNDPSAGDYEFWCRALKHTKFANIPEILLKYRKSKTSISATEYEIQKQNSNNIKTVLFKDLGIDVTNDELNLYRNIAYHQYKKDKQFVVQAENLLQRMLKANESHNMFQKNVFNNYTGNMWFNICTNSTVFGLWTYKYYYNSQITKFYKISVKNKIKLWLKSMLKYKQ